MGNLVSSSTTTTTATPSTSVENNVGFPHPLPSSLHINSRHKNETKNPSTNDDTSLHFNPFSPWKKLKTVKFPVSELCTVADMLYLCIRKGVSLKFCSYDELLSMDIMKIGKISSLVPCGQKVFVFAEYQPSCIIIDTNLFSYRYLEFASSDFRFNDLHHFSACLVGRKIYVIGGKSENANKKQQQKEKEEEDLNTEEGVCGVLTLDIGTFHCENVCTLGDSPPPLYCHFSVAIASKIFVFGGINLAQIRQSLYIFDTLTSRWSIPQTTGSAPSPSFVKGIIAHGVKLLAFCAGGNPSIYMLDIVNMRWGKLDIFCDDVLANNSNRVSMCLWGKKVVLHESLEKNRPLLSETADKGTLYYLELDKLHFSLFFNTPPTQNLSEDMRKAINVKLFSDVKIEVSSRNEVFYLHKCVLQARGVSDLLCQDCVVISEEFSYDVVKFAIDVIYGDNIQLPTELYDSFMKFVDKYQLSRIHKLDNNAQTTSDERPTIVSALEGDLSKMFLEKKNTDIYFKVEDKIISAHRIVLWSRSKYFKVMLESDMKEADIFSHIEVQDTRYADFECVLYWVYTGVLDLENPLQKGGVSPDPFGVFELANRYQIDDLVNLSTDCLCKNMDVESVVQLLEWSDALNVTVLKSACIDSIVLNYEAVLQIKNFHSLQAELRNKILKYLPF
eukprot:TRINITY_DN5974_c0_g1_i1.p1 TRINITY_DN5974_c0_g1~~TRINITY_DN5974_c0_g1_i1.p1  ORF type:complete len:672 (-),score=122.99 TRINITY_DN5974_c0_g1_i1:261-2276(-)